MAEFAAAPVLPARPPVSVVNEAFDGCTCGLLFDNIDCPDVLGLCPMPGADEFGACPPKLKLESPEGWDDIRLEDGVIEANECIDDP